MNRTTRLAAAIALVALAACDGGSSDKKTTPPPPPPPYPTGPVVVTTFQAASTLLGQLDWSSAAAGTCSASAFSNPIGSAAWDGANLLVPDTFNGRLLAFNPLPGPESDALAAPPAAFALGSTDAGVCDGLAEFVTPQFPSVSAGVLAVADPAALTGQGQVLLYSPVPSTGAPTASVAIAGIPACGGAGDPATAWLPSQPESALLAGSRLIVVDRGNHRVLLWNAVPADGATAPDAILGQADADGCLPNRGATAAADTLNDPKAAWSDGTRLVVADSGNHRLLVWNTFPSTHGAAADVVLTRATQDAVAVTAGSASFKDPQGLASDGSQLFVADTGNSRVLVYPAIPAAGDAVATVILGQAGWATADATPLPLVKPNDADHDGVADAIPAATTLSGPTGVFALGALLIVTDTGNGRVLIYRPPAQ